MSIDNQAVEIPMPRIGAELPTEVRIFSWGLNPTKKGPVYLTKAGASKIIEEYQKDGHALVFDKEHLMLSPNASAEDMEAQGCYKLSLREDGLWLTDIRWVPDAEKKIRDGKLLYFSPAVLKTRSTNVATKLINTALTNLPAMKGVRPLLMSALSYTGIGMDETLRTKVQPLKQMLSAGGILMNACQMAVEGSYDAPMKDLAQKINTILPDWIEAAAELLEQLDPEGQTLPEETKEMKMSVTAVDVAPEAAPAPAPVQEAVAEAPSESSAMDKLYALCKELTGKEDVDEIRGILRAMKHNQKVVEEQLSMAGKKIVSVTVDKAVASGLIRPAEKEMFLSMSHKELDAYMLSAKPIVSFDSVEQANSKVEHLQQGNAPMNADHQEMIARIFKRATEIK